MRCIPSRNPSGVLHVCGSGMKPLAAMSSDSAAIVRLGRHGS
jgi:hypothetical protein